MSTRQRSVVVCALLALAAGGCGSTQERVEAQAVDENGAPLFRVDPFWPKRLPEKWSMQQVVDLYVDVDDHVWIINRSVDAPRDEIGAQGAAPRTDCCVRGPEIIEFDPDGNVVN